MRLNIADVAAPPSGVAANTNLINQGGSSIFALNTSNFNVGGSDVPASAFTLEFVPDAGSGDFLQLTYTATPEPCTGMLVLGGVMPMLAGRRRRTRPTHLANDLVA